MKPLTVFHYVYLTLALGFSSSVFAATEWHMPTPYAEGIHHTENIQQFAKDLMVSTDEELSVHPGSPLFNHREIYHAVRTGQAAIGELFMGLRGKHAPIFKADNIPFLASNFEMAKRLWDVSRPYLEESLQEDGLLMLYAVPWPP